MKSQVDIHLGRRYIINTNQWMFDLLDRCNEIQAGVVAVVRWHTY